MKKLGLPSTFSRTVQKVTLLLLIMLVSMACEMDFGFEPEKPGTTQPTNPQTPNTPTSYHDFENFNPDNYPVINESGKADSAIADLRDAIWFMYAEKEDIGDWMANYVKTNNVKTILSNAWGAQAWIDPDPDHGLDSLYLREDTFNSLLGLEINQGVGLGDARRQMYGFATHETMHLVQYKSGAFDLMVGMRPDICAAVNMLTEYLADFYATGVRYPGYIITTDMENAVERQSYYMILSTDLDAYDAARTKDPSLSDYIFSSPWFKNFLGAYAEQAFSMDVVRRNAFTPPFVRQAKKI
jgi:hypothetical protein